MSRKSSTRLWTTRQDNKKGQRRTIIEDQVKSGRFGGPRPHDEEKEKDKSMKTEGGLYRC